jgi:hypothetical protein
MYRIFIVFSLIAFLGTACATTQEEDAVEETPVAQPTPEPEPVQVAEPVPAAPAPEPIMTSEPVRVLPETASPIPMVGLAGLGGLGLAAMLRVARRFIV